MNTYANVSFSSTLLTAPYAPNAARRSSLVMSALTPPTKSTFVPSSSTASGECPRRPRRVTASLSRTRLDRRLRRDGDRDDDDDDDHERDRERDDDDDRECRCRRCRRPWLCRWLRLRLRLRLELELRPCRREWRLWRRWLRLRLRLRLGLRLADRYAAVAAAAPGARYDASCAGTLNAIPGITGTIGVAVVVVVVVVWPTGIGAGRPAAAAAAAGIICNRSGSGGGV